MHRFTYINFQKQPGVLFALAPLFLLCSRDGEEKNRHEKRVELLKVLHKGPPEHLMRVLSDKKAKEKKNEAKYKKTCHSSVLRDSPEKPLHQKQYNYYYIKNVRKNYRHSWVSVSHVCARSLYVCALII